MGAVLRDPVIGDVQSWRDALAALRGVGAPQIRLECLSGGFRSAGVPFPTFVFLCSRRFYERWKQGDTSINMILVRFWI
ncbi:hypothetical protein DB459_06930 [Bradyrhizobium sp. WD16]|nr:hypothetical protein DB459_06930 [Bradyrhizobium sp. WD16]